MRKLFIVAAVWCMAVLTAQAQAIDLSEEEVAVLTEFVKQKIDDFQDGLADIGSKKNSPTVKDEAIKATLELFIGKGKPYRYLDNYGQERAHRAVTMQVTSKRYGLRPPQPMVQYLNRLKQLPYTRVEITQAGVVKVDVNNIRQTADGRYTTTAHFYQHFTAFNDNRAIVDDYDAKDVVIYMERVEYQAPSGQKYIWKVMLGDIKVSSMK